MIAFDTNILIYACDRSDSKRQQIAIDLVTNSRDGVLLWQVACEFIAASRKLSSQGFTAADAWDRLAEFMGVLPLVLPTSGALRGAQNLHVVRRVSFWDALILAACVEAGVETLYSEDVPGIFHRGRAACRQPVCLSRCGARHSRFKIPDSRERNHRLHRLAQMKTS
jgi:predicted nucleic acid-binding protein